jgi:DNA-binding HxlR family transcriptional regulator
MRSYGQYCSIARALDVVGDRWTLLIVRELLLQGPCRFTDLKRGLPGIAPNLLSDRLKELEQAGLISREEAPPPIATNLYAPTTEGSALEPVLLALGSWGLRFMAEEREDDAFRAHWLASAAASYFASGDVSGPPAVIQLVAADQAAVIDIHAGQLHARVGRTPSPDLTLDGPPRSILGLLTGLLDLKGAERAGLTVSGDTEVLARLST